MSTTPPTLTPTSSHSTTPPDLLGKFSLHPRADVILRSCDSHDFPVQKLYVIDSSPVLEDKIMAATSHGVGPEATVNDSTLLPIVQLPESHVIVSSFLTFVFPVSPVLPPTIEQTFELLSVAQKYQVTTILAQIRACAFQREPKPICSESALEMYSLAWKYGLLEEALLAAKETLKRPMTIRDFEDKLDILTSAALAELWKYRERVHDNISLKLNVGYVDLDVHRISTSLKCVKATGDPFNTPMWFNNYLDDVMEDPIHLDITAFHLALSSHISPLDPSSDKCSHCKSIPSETIRKLWIALTAVLHESIAEAESDFSFTQRGLHLQSSTLTTETEPPPEGLNMQGADVILQSSDFISFRVHKSIMAISSPFFNDLFSLPQPHDGELIDGLPVVHVSEDAEVLRTLLPLLYPIPTVIPDSYERNLDLLAASEKYNMDTASSIVRREMALPTTKAAFHAYAIASTKRLIPEIEAAARLTLDHAMSFENLIGVLPSLEGSALRDLVCFRKRCHENLLAFLVNFINGDDDLSKAWHSCRKTKRPHSTLQSDKGVVASWLQDLVSQHIKSLQETYTCPLPKSSSLRTEFTKALRAHISGTQCTSCSNLYATEGEALRDTWLRGVTNAWCWEPFQLDTGVSTHSEI